MTHGLEGTNAYKGLAMSRRKDTSASLAGEIIFDLEKWGMTANV
ncbi:MAG: hypothetical protein WKF97_17410 [Chitinophagaceae bacterium]